MKKTNILFGILAVLAFAVSCETKIDIQDNPVEPLAEQVTITASIPDGGLTKVSLTPAESGGKPILKLAWEDDDEITVNGETFTIVPASITGEGKIASFAGSDPGAGPYNIVYSDLPGDLSNQTQSADNNADHLGYAATLTGVDEYASIEFASSWAGSHGGTFSQAGALLIQAKLPTAAIADAVKKVIIRTTDNSLNGANTLSVNIGTPGVEGDGQVINVYATLSETATLAADSELIIDFQVSANAYDKYTAYRKLAASKNLEMGKLNEFKLNCEHINQYAGTSDAGTSVNPFLIGDKYQMAAITDELSTTQKKYFKLVDDITLSSWSNIDCDAKGAIDLDGNNKTIIGLNAPLFSFFNGHVSNLTITNADISAGGSYYGVLARSVTEDKECVLENISVKNSSLEAVGNIGGLIGRIDTSSSTLTNCSADVEVTGTGYYVGGLVGRIYNGTLTNCSATGKVRTSTHYAGGLIGLVVYTVSVQKCYSTCDIEPTAANTANHGGIVAHTTEEGNLTVKDCFSTGTYGTDAFKTRRWCGGILGTTASGSTVVVTNCYSTSTRVSANIGLEGALVGNNGCTNLTCTGYVGWSSLAALAGAGTAVSTDGNYLGQDGTISSQATALGWDGSIWNLSGSVPTLK